MCRNPHDEKRDPGRWDLVGRAAGTALGRLIAELVIRYWPWWP